MLNYDRTIARQLAVGGESFVRRRGYPYRVSVDHRVPTLALGAPKKQGAVGTHRTARSDHRPIGGINRAEALVLRLRNVSPHIDDDPDIQRLKRTIEKAQGLEAHLLGQGE